MIIALDLDSTLNTMESAWEKWTVENLDPNFTLDKWTSWDIHEVCSGGTKIYDFLSIPGIFATFGVQPDAQEVTVRMINAGHEIYIVSSWKLNPGSLKDKHDWMVEHFPHIHPDNICFLNNKGLIRSELLIDDALHNFSHVGQSIDYGQGLLLNRPWNVGKELPLLVHRMDNWREIETWLESRGLLDDGQ